MQERRERAYPEDTCATEDAAGRRATRPGGTSLHAEAAPKLSVHDYAAMPVYISLMKWTSRGLGGLPAWRDRLEEGEREIEKRGGRLIDVFVTLGRYDVVEIFEAPDDETATQILVGITKDGNVTTETLRAFTRDEAENIIRGL